MAHLRESVRSRSRWFLTAARLTNAQWLAVSVFEDVIDLPGRIAASPGGGALGPGSPARYHLPVAPVILGSAIGALATAPSARRGPLLISTTCTVAATALTAYLVRTVNVPLLEGEAAPERSRRLVGRWHALNKVRIGLLVAGGAVLETAAARPSKAP